MNPRSRRLVDAFSGAGGAAKGYQRAGFYVVGIDIAPQPHYCGDEFIQGDALEMLADLDWLAGFDAIHASPPCQAFTKTAASRRLSTHFDLIPATRAFLQASGLPWVIENVPSAPLNETMMLCGTSFGLPVIRHRLFETSWWPGLVPMCGSRSHNGVSGHGPNVAPFAKGTWEPRWRTEVLPVLWPWMTLAESCQAVPPAYTEYIGGLIP
jgi:DNA (cytosine-5)-methyltransferase 1